MKKIITSTLTILALTSAAPLFAEGGATLDRIECQTTSAPHYDVLFALSAVGDEPNVFVSSPGQTHYSGRYLINKLVGERDTRLAGLTWYDAMPSPQLYVSAFLHTYDLTHGGFGSVFVDGASRDTTCVGVFADTP